MAWSRSLFAALAFSAVALTHHAALAQARSRPAPGPTPESSAKDAINAGVVGLAGGQLEGAPIRLATEIARVVDNGVALHVLPIVTRGPAENIDALLYLRGVDLAIVNTDVLDQFTARVPQIRSRIAYVLNLFPSEVHVLVRPGIEKIEDLKGMKVNFNTHGTAAAYSGPLLFDKLGIAVEKTFIPHQNAIEQMASGDIAAVFFITSKPIDAFLKRRFPEGFKFLPVPFDERVSDYYLPASLTHSDYPALIKDGEDVQTISVPTVLAAFNWAPDTERYRRLTRFTNALFDNIGRLQAPGFDTKWQSVNLAAEVPSLTRFRPAQEWLDRASRAEAAEAAAQAQSPPLVDPSQARRAIARETRLAPAEQERLLREFLKWARDRR